MTDNTVGDDAPDDGANAGADAGAAHKRPPESRWNGSISITVTLTTSIFLLVLISVGAVLGVGAWLGRTNTFELLSQNAHEGISSAVAGVHTHLIAAQHQAEFVAREINAGAIDPTDRDSIGPFLKGALSAAPQIDAVMFVDTDFKVLLAGRDETGLRAGLFDLDFSTDPLIRESLGALDVKTIWDDPVWRESTGKTYLNVTVPVFRGGERIGAIVSVVSVAEISSYVDTGNSEDDPARGFVLYGREHVLAHPLLTKPFHGRSDAAPLPALKSFPDAVLAGIWGTDRPYELGLSLPEGTQGHVVSLNDDEIIFIYRELNGFGEKPLTVGAYFRAVEVGEEIRRLFSSIIVGVAALVLALIAAIILGRRIAKPVVRFSEAASKVQHLDIDKVEPLPGSIFRELNDQSRAFNTMLQGLRWFELYVPKKLVDRLVRRGESRESLSAARGLVVMFTDVAGFSTISENMTAPEVAALVNHHFGMVAKCIEEQEGTLDKFIGDSVMAFWGAPDAVEHAEEKACRAALAIAEAIHADNRARAAAGKAPVRMRIGIHRGPATVGNIGAAGRINYTIIGDTVNVGQRLEQLGKTIAKADTGADADMDEEVLILISGEVAARLGEGWGLTAAGRHALKGRRGKIEVFRLS